MIHYDVCGTSRDCFRVLHDARGLSVHFMLDIDGTIYQTLDAKERAFHATIANDRSVGVEIANIGAYPKLEGSPLEKWYAKDEAGRWRITLPASVGSGGVRTEGFVGSPERLVTGPVHGQHLTMFDLTPEQYESLIKLSAALHRALPGIALDYPRGPEGGVKTEALNGQEFAAFKGLLGHWHVQGGKVDPGPAFDWERVVAGAKRELGEAR
ncbi:MAG: N-acetylmuramoyl-L-alanine amidase [Phycisphaerales bacterium]